MLVTPQNNKKSTVTCRYHKGGKCISALLIWGTKAREANKTRVKWVCFSYVVNGRRVARADVERVAVGFVAGVGDEGVAGLRLAEEVPDPRPVGAALELGVALY